MNIDDRGLADLVYSLMLGEIESYFCPGLNVLVKDETRPGGLLYEQDENETAARKRFLSKYPGDAEAQLYVCVLDQRKEMFRKLAARIFRYALAFAPLLQSPPPTGDIMKDWNEYWSNENDLSPRKMEDMSQYLLKSFAETHGFIVSLIHGEERSKVSVGQLFEDIGQIAGLPNSAHDSAHTDLEARRRRSLLKHILEMADFLPLRGDEEEIEKFAQKAGTSMKDVAEIIGFVTMLSTLYDVSWSSQVLDSSPASQSEPEAVSQPEDQPRQ